MKTYELPVVNDRSKSFYGKAYVCEVGDEKILRSYGTDVCKIDSKGNVIRLWDGYSATTMRHINNFLALFNVEGGGKSWWDKLEVNR